MWWWWLLLLEKWWCCVGAAKEQKNEGMSGLLRQRVAHHQVRRPRHEAWGFSGGFAVRKWDNPIGDTTSANLYNVADWPAEPRRPSSWRSVFEVTYRPQSSKKLRGCCRGQQQRSPMTAPS